MPYIDLAFRLNGSAIPVDHGYALYATLSRIVPEIHQATDIGVHPIRGVYNGNGKLQLSDSSRLVLRLPDTAHPSLPEPVREKAAGGRIPAQRRRSRSPHADCRWPVSAPGW